jgi:hypothetical protein
VRVATGCDCPTAKSFDGIVGNALVPLMQRYMVFSLFKDCGQVYVRVTGELRVSIEIIGVGCGCEHDHANVSYY